MVDIISPTSRRNGRGFRIRFHAVDLRARNDHLAGFFERALFSIILRLVLESILNEIGKRSVMNPLNIDPFLVTIIDTGFKHLADSLRKVRGLPRSIVAVAVRLLC